MVYRYTFRLCDVCVAKQGGWYGHGDMGLGDRGITLDGRRMFLKGGNAVVMCRNCGREYVLGYGVKCSKKRCGKPVRILFRPAYYNCYDPHGVCQEHISPWLKAGKIKRFLYGMLVASPIIDYLSDDFVGKCPMCGFQVDLSKKADCANRDDRSRCPKCGKKLDLFEKVLTRANAVQSSSGSQHNETSVDSPGKSSSGNAEGIWGIYQTIIRTEIGVPPAEVDEQSLAEDLFNTFDLSGIEETSEMHVAAALFILETFDEGKAYHLVGNMGSLGAASQIIEVLSRIDVFTAHSEAGLVSDAMILKAAKVLTLLMTLFPLRQAALIYYSACPRVKKELDGILEDLGPDTLPSAIDVLTVI